MNHGIYKKQHDKLTWKFSQKSYLPHIFTHKESLFFLFKTQFLMFCIRFDCEVMSALVHSITDLGIIRQFFLFLVLRITDLYSFVETVMTRKKNWWHWNRWQTRPKNWSDKSKYADMLDYTGKINRLQNQLPLCGLL